MASIKGTHFGGKSQFNKLQTDRKWPEEFWENIYKGLWVNIGALYVNKMSPAQSRNHKL